MICTGPAKMQERAKVACPEWLISGRGEFPYEPILCVPCLKRKDTDEKLKGVAISLRGECAHLPEMPIELLRI